MMMTLTGQTFGRLNVGEFRGRDKYGNSLWECKCSCGEIIVRNSNTLRTGNVKSCGCLKLGKDKKAKPPKQVIGAKWVQLTKGKWCLVDEEDYDLVSRFEWMSSPLGYATKNPSKKCRSRFLHRLVMGEPDGKQVDHKSMNTWDNRKDNLRVATDTQNKFNKGPRKDNKSGYKGVSKHQGAWSMEICAFGKRERRSGFSSPELAHRAYIAASNRLHGEFARSL